MACEIVVSRRDGELVGHDGWLIRSTRTFCIRTPVVVATSCPSVVSPCKEPPVMRSTRDHAGIPIHARWRVVERAVSGMREVDLGHSE